MMKKKINVGILFGGKSAEHEISLRSAKNVIEALDKSKFSPVLIGISQEGTWLFNETALIIGDMNKEAINLDSDHVSLVPQSSGKLTAVNKDDSVSDLDVVFPILHGPFGEDGTVQGLLKLADIPFVGAGVLGSAVGMDKDVMKRLLRDSGINVGPYQVIRDHEERPTYEAVVQQLGLPCFVKPANLGSSVGITKVNGVDDFDRAIEEAFSYDRKIIIESFIEGREIECAVLGNEFPKASLPGEITFTHDFYSFEAKYEDDQGYKIEIPAVLSDDEVNAIQETAIKTFKVLECEGFGRVDVFLTPQGEIYVNEINTIPGFTQISMYPKLWEATGLAYTDLITELLTLAIDRHDKEKKIRSIR